MTLMRKPFLALCLLIICALPLKAQFYLAGDDPAHLRWFSLETAHYQVIFPQGADTLARNYGRYLEIFRPAVGRSLGLTPGTGQNRKMPVVLHTHNMYSNGSMGWAPSRMDLYTQADPYGGDPVLWPIQLAAHEPRHQVQMEFASRGFTRWLSGEGWAPIHWQLYIEQAIAEGDAVATETGISTGTRARTADFLNYFRVALDQGDFRSWDHWRYGSYKRFTPDLYKVGYMTVAGARVLYDDPLIVRKAMDLSWKKPWYVAPSNLRTVMREHSGKPFRESFKDILNLFNTTWQADAAARGPFMEMEQVTTPDAYATDYWCPAFLDDELYVLRTGQRYTEELLKYKDGRFVHAARYPSHGGTLLSDELHKRFYWTETLPNPRWSLDGSSIIRYYDASTGRTGDLTHGTRYFNPQVAPEEMRIGAVEHLTTGQTAVVVLDIEDGHLLNRYPLPQGFSATELAWKGDDDLYVCAVSEGGSSIHHLREDGSWEMVLAPSPQKIVNLGSGDENIEWVSDRTGVNELYFFYPDQGRLVQKTNTRYGATDFWPNDTHMYFSSQTLDGTMIFRVPLEDLLEKEASYSEVHTYPIEDKLTAQEQALGEAPDLAAAVPVSAPKRYNKLAHPLRLHTWLPLYVNYDAVKEGSMDLSYETASIGLSGFFQNTLGTFSGMIGYGLHPDPDVDGRWRNSLHLKMVYTGLYPVIEASADFGDQAARQYFVGQYKNGEETSFGLQGPLRNAPSFTASVRTYVPLSWHKAGLLWGFTPQLRYSVSNSWITPDPVVFEAPVHFHGLPAFYSLSSIGKDRSSQWMQHLNGSLRGYLMLPRADAQIYPRWGIGLEGGISLRPGITKYFAPNVYGYAYGYVPGITRNQGLRLSGLIQKRLGEGVFGELAASTLPRGFEGEAASLVGATFPFQWKVTADYAIPIYVGDLSIPWVAYIKNFLLTPHADFTALGTPKDNLWSVGADFSASLARLLFLPFDASVGVGFSYLGGSWYKNTAQEKPWSVEMIFSVDF